MTKYILSIDGGGVRGIIPLCVLQKLENQVGLSLPQIIHFCGGTSTGAIITAGISTGMFASEMLYLYLELGPSVFKDNWVRWVINRGLYRYDTRLLAERVRQFTKDVTLNELPIDVLLTTVRVSDGHLWWLVKDNEGNAKTTGNLRLFDCATASSAAPVLFKPWRIPTLGDCVDGGAGFSANPVYRTCVEAFEYTDGKYDPSDTIVVSLGTGEFQGPFEPKSILGMVSFTLGSILGSTAGLQTTLVKRFYSPKALYRINIELPSDIAMDDFSSRYRLLDYGRELASQVDWQSILRGEVNRWLVT